MMKTAGKKLVASTAKTFPAGRYKDQAQQGLYLLVRDRVTGPPSRTWQHQIKAKDMGFGDTFFMLGHYPATTLAEARILVQGQRELVGKGIDPRRAASRRIARRPNTAGLLRAPLPPTYTASNTWYRSSSRRKSGLTERILLTLNGC